MIDEENKKHYWLYALKLEKGKYYVGTTTKKDPYDRIKMHGGFYGAKWTMKYKPVEVLEIRDIGVLSEPEKDVIEQMATMRLIDDFGYKNVRGGFLRHSGKYYKLGNRYFRDSDFESLIAGLLLITTALLLFIKSV